MVETTDVDDVGYYSTTEKRKNDEDFLMMLCGRGNNTATILADIQSVILSVSELICNDKRQTRTD